MADYNPCITGWYNPLYTANKQGFGHCSCKHDMSLLDYILHRYVCGMIPAKYA